MIAVLPFKNLGSADDEYFADGITDEVITRLANISGLGVISRNSSMKYKGTDKSLQEIGRELGVQHVLEGTVRYDRSTDPPQVRISPQLIRVGDDTHIWAQTYDRAMDRIFEVQSNIAEQVASQLEVALLAGEQTALDEAPTDNLEAYNYFLRSQYYHWNEVSRENTAEIIDLLNKAVEADPEFVRAWAQLGFNFSIQYHRGWDLSDRPLKQARAYLDRALQLDPQSYIAHMFDGYYHYHNNRDYEQALQSLQEAEKYNPTEVPSDLFAWIWRRQGKHLEAIDLIEKRIELDPINGRFLDEIAYSLFIVRKYDEALERVNKAIAVHPDNAWVYEIKWQILLGMGRTLADTRATILESPDQKHVYAVHVRYWQERMEGNHQEAARVIMMLDPPFLEEQEWAMPAILLRGFALRAAGRSDAARADFKASATQIRERLIQRPNDSRLHSSLGLALAGLGQNEEAIVSGLKAIDLNPMERDDLEGAYRVEDLAWIYALAGEHDLCMDRLEFLMSRPTRINVNYVKVDPRWDSVREHPRFEALLAKGDPIT
jgi:TolB-like protein/cytochrome c-type biogenesis protein CcmH/NrfG